MSGNKLLIATLVFAALLGVTLMQFTARDSEDARGSDVVVKLPKLKKEDIDELSLAAPEKKAVLLKKVDGKWKVTEPLTAAADNSAVDTALAKLAELEVIGVAATKAENHEKLEVTDAKATHVIAKQGGKPLADLLVGAYRSGNTMVREPSSANVAVVKGSIKYAFEKDLKDWRDRAVCDATTEQVQAVSFDNAGGSFHFVKEDGTWKQAPGDKVLPNFESGKIVSLVGTAITMRANDFAAENITADAAGVGDKSVGLVTLTLGGDAAEQQILLHIGNKVGDNYYLRREGKDAIFVVSPFAGERMLSTAEKFQKDDKPAEAKAEVRQVGGKTVEKVYPIPMPKQH